MYFKFDTWISLSCYYMDLLKLIIGFLLVVMWICQSCYIDLISKVVTRICQSCSTFFSLFAKQNQAEVLPRFQSLLKLLLWNKVVEWVNVLNALGPLCLWQCFALHCTMFPLSNKSCLKSNKLRPILNCQICHVISKKICLNVFGSKQTREILAFVILKL